MSLCEGFDDFFALIIAIIQRIEQSIVLPCQLGEFFLPSRSVLGWAILAEPRKGFAQHSKSLGGAHCLKPRQRVPPMVPAGVEEVLGQAAVIHFPIIHQHSQVTANEKVRIESPEQRDRSRISSRS